MRPDPESKPAPNPSARPSDLEDAPGLPGFRTWRSVYWFVLGAFAAVVLALTFFSRFYA